VVRGCFGNSLAFRCTTNKKSKEPEFYLDKRKIFGPITAGVGKTLFFPATACKVGSIFF
jgi:hypothetical protein